MLNIFLGEMKDVIYHPPTYFDNVYEDEWITDPLSIEMIRDIDKSDVIGGTFDRKSCSGSDIAERLVWRS